MRLQDKICVVTGASSGIGKATALLFAREGAQVVCVDIDEQGGEKTVDEINQVRKDALFIKADVSNAEEVRTMAEKCQQNVSHVDVLFNNAGSHIIASFEETSEDIWNKMLGDNLTGIFLCTKYLLPLLKKTKAGSIINNASIHSLLGEVCVTAYCAAKGGIIPLTHVMAREFAQYNVRVNCLSTGGIASGLMDPLPRLIQVTPLGRMGTPDEAANAVLFFASEESSYITGANLVIDGGRTAITQGCF